MFDFSVSKDTKTMDMTRGVAVGDVAACLCLTLIVKELRNSVVSKVRCGNDTKYHQTPSIMLSVVFERDE